MAMDRASAEAQRGCPLRGLTLCDGQQLEKPDRTLASCLCWLEERSEEAGYGLVSEACADERDGLVRALGMLS